MTRFFLLSSILFFSGSAFSAMPTQQALETQSQNEGWTFKASAKREMYATGLIAKPAGFRAEAPSKMFLQADGSVPKSVQLKDRAELSAIYNQGSCGSCVYNAVNSTWMDTMRLRGIVTPMLARQELMDCFQRDWRCSGSFFEKVAAGALDAKQLQAETDYPYKAQDGSCKAVNGVKHGKIESWKLIDNSAKSIMNAINNGYAVAVTVGAGGAWMSYDSGVYNGCSSVGTNHQTSLVGYDCETAVDASGNCVFDAKGNLPAGVGIWTMRNSWGTNWGENGFMRTKITSRSGQLCNNLASEAGIIEVGVAPTPPKPPVPPVPPVPPTPPGPSIPVWVWLIMGVLGFLVFGLAFLVFQKKQVVVKLE